MPGDWRAKGQEARRCQGSPAVGGLAGHGRTGASLPSEVAGHKEVSTKDCPS